MPEAALLLNAAVRQANFHRFAPRRGIDRPQPAPLRPMRRQPDRPEIPLNQGDIARLRLLFQPSEKRLEMLRNPFRVRRNV